VNPGRFTVFLSDERCLAARLCRIDLPTERQDCWLWESIRETHTATEPIRNVAPVAAQSVVHREGVPW
jgi:hypothetical protein